MANSRDWQRVRALFEAALDIPTDRRTAWLADACAGTYRGLRAAEVARLADLDALDVTFASHWLLLRRS